MMSTAWMSRPTLTLLCVCLGLATTMGANASAQEVAPLDGKAGAAGKADKNRGDGYQSLSTYEEAIRTLRNSILLTDFDRRLRSVLMTSASPSEGKSTVAAHLAATHASQHKRTLLIDGDLRRPSVHRLYQVPNSVGLSNVLLQQISWRDAVVRMNEPADLDILPAGCLFGSRFGHYISLSDRGNSTPTSAILPSPATRGPREIRGSRGVGRGRERPGPGCAGPARA